MQKAQKRQMDNFGPQWDIEREWGNMEGLTVSMQKERASIAS